MSKTKKIISLVLVAMLVMAMATVALVSTSAMSADEIHVVAGAPELCGSNWDPADTNNQMTYNAEKDIYEKVFTNVAAGTYDFKVTTNYAWDQGDFNLTGDAMYGGPNATVTVDADGSTVIVGFNGAHATVDVVAGSDTPVESTPVESTPVESTPVESTPVDTPVTGDTITIYFENNWMWPEVSIYYWGGADGENAEWPGAAMTEIVGKSGDGVYDIYKMEVPADITGIVFSGEGGYGRDQSEDVTDIKDGFAYYMTYDEATGTKPCESYEYAPVESTPVESTPVESTPVETESTPVESTPVESTPVESTPVESTPAEEGTAVILNGAETAVAVGDVITYTVDLTAARLFENIQAIVSYDATKLQLTRYESEDPDVEDWEVEGPIACPNLDGVIYNAGVENQVKFNASKVAGYNFKEGANLVTLEFTVIAEGTSEIDLVIEEMTIKGGEESYFTDGAQVITDGITVTEALNAPEVTTPSTSETIPSETESTPVVADKNTVSLNDGDVYEVTVGDEITYYVDLTAARLFENIQAIVSYDATKLELVRYESDDPDVEDWEVEGPIACPNLDGVIFNAGEEGVVKFNASKVAGYNFKEEANLLKLTFKVVGEGESLIDLVIEEMTIKGGEESYFTNGQAVTTEGIVIDQYITGNTIPSETVPGSSETVPGSSETVPGSSETVPGSSETVPGSSETVPGSSETVPGSSETVPGSSETVPGSSETVPGSSETVPGSSETKPVESKPAPTEGATSTEGTEDKPESDPVETGAAAYIYVVMAVLTVAALAVVVLRKKVNE